MLAARISAMEMTAVRDGERFVSSVIGHFQAMTTTMSGSLII